MAKKLVAYRTPEKWDFYLLGLISVFSLYMYWAKDKVFRAYEYAGTDGYSFQIVHIVFVLVPLFAFVFILFGLTEGNWTGSRFGLTLGKSAIANFVLSGLLIIGLIFFLEGPTTSDYTFTQSVIIVLNITAGEIIIRAAVMELMLKVFGKTAVGINLAFILSILLYVTVQVPSETSTHSPILWGVCLALWYYGTHSVLLLVVLNSLIFLPELHVTGHLVIAVMAVALYFALATPATFICRSRQQRLQPEYGHP